MRKILILIFLYPIVICGQGIVEAFNSEFQKFEKPEFESILNMKNGQDSISFEFEDKHFSLISNHFDSTGINVKNISLDITLSQFSLPLVISPKYLNSINSFDVDSDGNKDLLISFYPYGVTGLGANIERTLCLFIGAKTISFYLISTFGIDIEHAFYDLNHDNKYEFICVSAPIGDRDYAGTQYHLIKPYEVQEKNFVELKMGESAIPKVILLDSDKIMFEEVIPASFEKNWNFGPDLWKK
ncbi:MAG: hypothetical protein SCALA702_02400 [Melioribacteraceae bacterium]|nr:MAG: hypothetical protein SCALA702_02400 [Melioribacteraceae bacterium]